MMINDILTRAKRNKTRKRVGRGPGSGSGKTSGRGHKGCKSRAGGGTRLLTEGGQMPFFRRIPKRGFNNAQFRTEYQVVNVSVLNDRYDDGAKVTLADLEEAGLIHDAAKPVKILGNGEIGKKIEVQATRFSAQAAEKITKAGGQATKIG